MNTDALLYEVQSLKTEIDRLKKDMKRHNTRIKNLMDQVIENMLANDEHEHTFNGKTYKLNENTIHTRKTDDKKKKDALLVLEEEGIEGPGAEQVYNKIVDAFKGPEKTRYVLK